MLQREYRKHIGMTIVLTTRVRLDELAKQDDQYPHQRSYQQSRLQKLLICPQRRNIQRQLRPRLQIARQIRLLYYLRQRFYLVQWDRESEAERAEEGEEDRLHSTNHRWATVHELDTDGDHNENGERVRGKG